MPARYSGYIAFYLDACSFGHHLNEKLRKWAKNCQEHLSINYLPHTALVSWTPWTALIGPPPPTRLLVPGFSFWYTLGKFRENHRPTDVKKEDYVERVICFVRALGGDEGTKVFDFVKLIVAASDWGYRCVWVDDDVLHMARTLIDHFGLEKGKEKLELGK